MSIYVEVWIWTVEFNMPRWKEEWWFKSDVKKFVDSKYLKIVKRRYILLDMEMIQTSKNHACVRKLYALDKDRKRQIEMEFIPCKKYEELDEKYQVSFDYCKRRIHKLEYYPKRKDKFCQDAQFILKNFLDNSKSDMILYKGGQHEKNISNQIGVDSFDMEKIDIKKVKTHNPKEEINLHYDQLINIVFSN